MKGALARSSLLTGMMLGLRVMTQALVLVMLTRLLGPGRFGVFASATSLAVVLGILPNLGAGFMMLARAPQGREAVADVWRYAWPMTVLLGVVLLIAYLPAAKFIAGASSLSWTILLALAISELLLMPMVMLCSYVLQATDRVPLSQFVQWLPLGLRTVAAASCFLVSDADRLQWYAGLQALMAVVGLAVGLFITREHLRWHPRLASPTEIREGALYASMHLVAANPSELDKITAVRLVGAAGAGVYVAATRVMGAMVTPVTALLLATQPRIFRHASMPSAEGHRLIRTVALLAGIWGLFCGVLLAVSGPLLIWLFGSRFSVMADFMPLIALVAAPLSLRLVAGTMLVALGRPLERVAFELCGIGVLVITMSVLAPLMGVKGIIVGLLASECSMMVAGWWRLRRWWFRHSAG